MITKARFVEDDVLAKSNSKYKKKKELFFCYYCGIICNKKVCEWCEKNEHKT